MHDSEATRRERVAELASCGAFLLFIFASAAPIPGREMGFRAAILLFFALLGPLVLRRRTTSREWAFLLYLAFVGSFVRQWDYFSQRILFNLAVLAAGVLLARLVRFRAWMLWLGALLELAISVHRSFQPSATPDGKVEVHWEVLIISLLLLVLIDKPGRAYGSALLTAMLFKIRSVTFGALMLVPLARRHVLVAAAVLGVTFAAIVSNVDWLAQYVDSDSLRWRLYHWSQVLGGFGWRDYLVGRGLGYSWRASQDFVYFDDHEGYYAAHSNYVKIISETGIVGLVGLLLLVARLARDGSPVQRRLLVLYLGYGLFDEGIWHFHILWVFVVGDAWTWPRRTRRER